MEKDKKSRLAYICTENEANSFRWRFISVIHKTNPMSAALSPKARVWRKREKD